MLRFVVAANFAAWGNFLGNAGFEIVGLLFLRGGTANHHYSRETGWPGRVVIKILHVNK
ncbi:MAG TPA: hypothetical protein VIH76_07645 [Candidatus Acidoferrales bacterium]